MNLRESFTHSLEYRAQAVSASCVPTCLGMMMTFWGVYVEQKMIDLQALSLGGGRYGVHKAILETARHFGFPSPSMAYVRGDYAAAKSLITGKLQTQPILVTGRFHHYPELGSRDGHAVVTVGLNLESNQIIFHDPHHKKAERGEGAARALDLDSFINLWAIQHLGWALWLRDDI